MTDHGIVVPAGAKVWSFITALRHTAGLARSHLYVDREAAANGIGPVHGPTANKVTEQTTRLSSPAMARSERQLVAVGEDEVVFNMQRRQTALRGKIVPVVHGKTRGSRDLLCALDTGSPSVVDITRPGVRTIE